MGAFLDKPITEKTTESGEGIGLRYGVSAMQGWRKEMEDKHICKTNFKLKNHAFFGVFDGHAGSKASEHCSEKLLECITHPLDDVPSNEALKKAIRDGFLKVDRDMKENWGTTDNRGGTTAITVMITPDHIIFGNCGDSRGLLCRNGELVFTTEDHKPSNNDERKRIEEAGGSVMMQRVNGSLAVSRALGDFEFKMNSDLPAEKQLVSPEPEVTVLERCDDKDQFLFLACDGVYDVMTNEEIVKFILKKLRITDDLKQICSDLIDTCLNKNSRDNMSAILITFKAAPKVSEEAIAANKKLQEKLEAYIERKLQEFVDQANDPLEVEESEVLHKLGESLLSESDLKDCDITEKRQHIANVLADKKKGKFKESLDTSDDSFYHPSFGEGPGVFLKPDPEPMPGIEGERPSDNLPSPVQTDGSHLA